jgi:geranylgeranyl diphosphate synthase, type II
MQKNLNLINNRLDKLVKSSKDYHKDLFAAARYALLSKGKRLRALLVLETIASLSKDIKKGLDVACALEMVHTYSLIHDDLPCMDNDDFRRGKPTLHKKYNEWLAILTGDYLLTYSFEIIANAKLISDKQKTDLIKVLSYYSGSSGMLAGQIVDLEYENKKISSKILEFMHLKKTAALFIAAIELGSIIANANNSIRSKLKEFAKYLGLSFQFFDDIEDAQDKKSSDIVKKKASAVSTYGYERALKLANKYQEKSLIILASLPIKKERLSNIVKSFS